MVRDFLGQELKEGDFVVYPGGGNVHAEYGLILMWVLGVVGDGIQIARLFADHNEKKVVVRKSTIKANTKVVKVQPPPKMLEVFHNAWLHEGKEYYKLVTTWTHGRTDIDWTTLTIGKMRK